MVDDQGCINSVPIGFEDGVYQFSIYREDGWPFMGWLEVNTWYELNYNEYRTVIYGDYNSSPINIMGISTDYDTVNFFQEDDTIEFAVMGGDVYDVLAFYPDSGAEIYFDREVTTDEYGTEIYTYSFTPETNDPFEISIFLTENDYDFWSFRPVEGQKSYEFWVNVNGIEDFDLEDFINFDTDNEGIIDSMFITDGGYKVIYDEEAAVLYIGLDPDKIPEDANFEVISDGEDITEEVIGNDYIIEVPLDGDYVPPLDINIWTDGVWVAGYWFESDEDSPIVNIWYALDDSEEFTLVPSVYDEEYPEDDPKTILNYSEVGEAETITFKFEVEEGFIPKTASIWFGGGRGSELHVAEDDGFYYLVIDTSMVEDQEYDTHIRLMDREEPCDFEYGFELIGRGDVTVNEDPDAFDKYYDYETGEPITFTVEGDIYKVCAYAFGEYIDVEEVNGVYTFTPQDRVVEPTEYSEGYVQPFYFGFYFKIYVTEAEYEYDQTPWPQYPQEYMQIFIGNEEYVTISEQDSVAQTWVGAGRIKVLINDFYNNDTVVLVDIEWPEGCDAVFVNGVEFEDTQYEWKPCLEGNLTIEFLGEEPLTEDPGWHEDEAGNKYYIKDNGQRATGLRDIDGEKYFFDNSGKAVAGWRQDGEGNWYYFQEVGVVATGLTKIGKNTFFFDEEGIMQTGLVETEDGTYLFNAGGYMQTGKQVVDGDTYFFGADGKMLTNYWFKMEDGKYNYFGEDGVMVFGTFATIKNSVYYFDADGIMATGWKKISGKYHYFLGGGAMVTGFRTISGKTYLFDDQGVMLTGWQEADGKKYYFESSGAMATGWKKLDGKWYYFDGAMATGLQTISGKKFFFDDQGVMQTGWQTADGQSYYFIDSGEMAADAIVTIESATFYFDADGKIVKNSWISKDGNYYYFGTEGEMLKGWQEIKSKWYYFDENGVMLTGWQKLSSKWYYFEGSGAMVSGWKKLDGKWYYFEGSGAMVSGWKKLDGKWYYFDGGAMATKWAKIDGKWYYFGTDGIMVTGWQEIGGSWYYFKNGAMVTGTQKIGSKTYVFDSNGVWIG